MIKPFSYLHYSSYEFSCNDEQSFFTFVSAYYLLLFIFSGLCQYRPCETTAFMDYVEKGRGGWIDLHHATLLGDFDGGGKVRMIVQFDPLVRLHGPICS